MSGAFCEEVSGFGVGGVLQRCMGWDLVVVLYELIIGVWTCAL